MKRFCCYLIFGLQFLLCSVAYSQTAPGGKCGNGNSKGPSDPPPEKPPAPGDPFNAYTGNEHRVINDLEIWGSPGTIPFVWKRYYNSREFTNFSFSFQYTMTDAGVNILGQARVNMSFPDGKEIIFAQSSTDPSRWLPPTGVEERVFQDGNNLFLQNAEGHRYRFRRFNNPEGSFYQLLDFRDNYNNLYTLSYSGPGVSRITEPGGRYFEVSYSLIGSQPYIDKVTTSDGRSVQYNYTVFQQSVFSWVKLTSVDYGDGTHANYTYHSPHFSLFGFLYMDHAIDPRYDGVHGDMRFTYDNSIARGYIKEEFNGKTGHLMSTLTTASNNRWVCYPNGRVQHYVMPDDQEGRTTEYTDGLGRTTKYGYDANGFIAQETDELNRTTTYLNSSFGNPLEITHPDGTKEKWTRDDLDMILTYTDELNRVTTFTRDALHRVTKITYPDGSEESFTYNSFGQVLTHILRNGGIETNTYDISGLKTSFRDPSGKISFYTHDAAHRLASVTDARGNITRYEYNERGLLTKLTNADNSFKLYAYDAFGNRTSTTNELGHSWTTLFDEFKRPVSSTDPLNRQTFNSYDLPGGISGSTHANNDPTQIVLPSGKLLKREYDMEWQLIKEIKGANSPDAATTLYEYDAAGNLTGLVDPKLQHWIQEYDVRDRKISSRDPLGNKTEWSYDAAGNKLTEKRPDNGLNTYEYDNMDRLVKSTNPRSEVTIMMYDSEGNLVRLTDAKNENYDFEYDLLSRRTKNIYPSGSSESFIYDAVSNLQSFTNRSGNVRTYQYDSRNREIQCAWNDNTPAISRSYDVANRLLTLSSNVSVLAYTYNVANEVTGETQNIAGSAGIKQINYLYNTDGLRSNMAYPGGATSISYDYTSRNEIASISENGQVLAFYGYDLNGNRVAQFRKNQAGTSHVYDPANRVLSISHQKAGVNLAQLDYGYDNMNRRTFVKRNYAQGDVYSYDAIDQVTAVQYEVTNPDGMPAAPARTVSYNYDAAGNRTQLNDNGIATAYVSNNLNQYTMVGVNALTYNQRGDLQTHDGWTYTYDAQDRLISAVKGANTMSFAYDARNRCVKRTINGTTNLLYYDEWNLIQEYTSANVMIRQYVHGATTDELLTMSSTGGTVYYHQDVQGSVILLTDNNGSMVEQYSYDVFGSVTIKDNNGNVIASSSFGNRFLFTGREFIEEIGLYDYRNRMYSALLGRFLQTDPIRFVGGDMHLYRYVGNNVVNMIDPLGLKEQDAKDKLKEGFLKGNLSGGYDFGSGDFNLSSNNSFDFGDFDLNLSGSYNTGGDWSASGSGTYDFGDFSLGGSGSFNSNGDWSAGGSANYDFGDASLGGTGSYNSSGDYTAGGSFNYDLGNSSSFSAQGSYNSAGEGSWSAGFKFEFKW